MEFGERKNRRRDNPKGSIHFEVTTVLLATGQRVRESKGSRRRLISTPRNVATTKKLGRSGSTLRRKCKNNLHGASFRRGRNKDEAQNGMEKKEKISPIEMIGWRKE